MEHADAGWGLLIYRSSIKPRPGLSAAVNRQRRATATLQLATDVKRSRILRRKSVQAFKAP